MKVLSRSMMVAACALVALTVSLSAHMALQKADPARDATVTATPKHVQLWFTEKPDLKVTKVELKGPAGPVKLAAAHMMGAMSVMAALEGELVLLAARAGPLPGELAIAVVGAHLSGMALNHELRALGGLFLRAAATESSRSKIRTSAATLADLAILASLSPGTNRSERSFMRLPPCGSSARNACTGRQAHPSG